MEKDTDSRGKCCHQSMVVAVKSELTCGTGRERQGPGNKPRLLGKGWLKGRGAEGLDALLSATTKGQFDQGEQQSTL